LCNGRSGSTLLRFLLDAHPDLACPPETNLPVLCAQLATVWSLIEGAPLSVNRGDEPPLIPETAIGGIRETMDRMTGSYLTRRGKARYCDKSLGSARYAELLLRVYPEAKFICLYRHPMDVIASGMEACPWGLNGYGFDSYIATTPGNVVLALARYWADSATEILAAEEKFPGRCVRVRYEDLVTDPERAAREVFSFLDVDPVPGISARCFSAERERFGPGDHKIWHTSRVTAGSVGRGWSIPAGLIAPQVLVTINDVSAQLGYLPVDGSWGASEPPADLRIPAGDRGIARAGTAPRGEPVSGSLGDRLRAGMELARPQTAARWESHDTETAVAVWIPADPGQPAEHWLIDLKNRAVAFTTGAAQESSDWDVIGSAAAWEQVIAGTLNLSAALRGHQLRYCDNEESRDMVAGEARIAILGQLLGITEW
jgi:hypothetical protein